MVASRVQYAALPYSMSDEPKWSLFVRWRATVNSVPREHETFWHAHYSIEEAVQDACRLPSNVTAVRLEGPNGVRFDEMEIANVRADRRSGTFAPRSLEARW
jgi:hypothetical protein